jgi:glutamine amidotransferase
MCRVLAYLGEPVLLDDLLFRADRALVRQAVDPQLMSLMNLGGFGFMGWDAESREPERPFAYRIPHIPVYDRNLKALAEKVSVTGLLAHVRGVIYEPDEVVGGQNVHPFRFPGIPIALAQNGDLYGFGQMRYDLLEHIRPELARHIEGTTDTEWLYALVLSQLPDPTAPMDAIATARAIEQALEIVRLARERRGIAVQW